MPRPVAGTKPSTDMVNSAPANLSASDLYPCRAVQVLLLPCFAHSVRLEVRTHKPMCLGNAPLESVYPKFC